MNKKRKDNLIKAFEELNTPDKDVLLQKIESKKALGGNVEAQKTEQKQKAIRRNRVAWASFASSLVVIVLAIVLISISVFGGNKTPDKGNDGSIGDDFDGSNNIVGSDVIDYRSSWKFTLDNNISFNDTDKNIKDAGIELIYDYLDDWTIVETQVTQDKSAYREYYVKDGVTVEVTVFLAENVTSMDGRYYVILQDCANSFVSDKYKVYRSSYSINGAQKQAYKIFLKDQVYVFTSDVDLIYLLK